MQINKVIQNFNPEKKEGKKERNQIQRDRKAERQIKINLRKSNETAGQTLHIIHLNLLCQFLGFHGFAQLSVSYFHSEFVNSYPIRKNNPEYPKNGVERINGRRRKKR